MDDSEIPQHIPLATGALQEFLQVGFTEPCKAVINSIIVKYHRKNTIQWL